MNFKPLFDWFASVVRTSIVPAIVGVLVAGAAYSGTDLPPGTVALITAGFTFAYWAIVRALELRFPRAGWLLLMPRPPAYSAAQAVAYVRSAVRTLSPLVVGVIVTFLARHGVDTEFTSSLLTVVASGIYYSGVRFIEGVYPKLGVLLGATGAPIYAVPNLPVDEV